MVVVVVVSALRRKLGERAGALETVRGIGYRLQPLA
jgi:DNA-binding response OmpR family regulator